MAIMASFNDGRAARGGIDYVLHTIAESVKSTFSSASAKTVGDVESQKQQLASAPPPAPESSTSPRKRLLLTLLSFLALTTYTTVCLWLGFDFLIHSNTLDNKQKAKHGPLLTAAGILVGLLGPLLAIGSFVYGSVTTARGSHVPRVMKYTLHTAPVMVHALLLLTPLTVAARRVPDGTVT